MSPFSSRLVCFLLQGVPTAVARSVCPHPLGPRLPAAGEHVTAAVASAGGLPPDSAAFPFALPARALVGSQLRGIRTRLCGNRWGGGGGGVGRGAVPPSFLPSPPLFQLLTCCACQWLLPGARPYFCGWKSPRSTQSRGACSSAQHGLQTARGVPHQTTPAPGWASPSLQMLAPFGPLVSPSLQFPFSASSFYPVSKFLLCLGEPQLGSVVCPQDPWWVHNHFFLLPIPQAKVSLLAPSVSVFIRHPHFFHRRAHVTSEY